MGVVSADEVLLPRHQAGETYLQEQNRHQILPALGYLAQELSDAHVREEQPAAE